MTMHILVIFAFGLAVVLASSTPPTAKEGNCSSKNDNLSLLSSILSITGYSDTCVASALDFCSTGQDNSRYVSLMEEAMGVVQRISAAVDKWDSQITAVINRWDSRPRHCKDLLDSNDSGSGLREIYPYPGRLHHSVTVFCDHTVDGGGWTVVQRRTSDAVRQDFYRTYNEYRVGFGDKEAEFWIGLDLLHLLTSNSLQELRIDLDDYEGEHRWAKYKSFHVEAPETKYRLNVRNYSGDAGDSLAYHNKLTFSTHDFGNTGCAVRSHGGFWYNNCHHANLNGYQYVGNNSPNLKGIIWYQWKGFTYSLKRTTMMIRPAF